MMLGCNQVCQRGYQQGKQRHCSIAVMEILSAYAKLMSTTGYLLSRFARSLILYTVWNLEEKNSITSNTAFWVVSKMLIHAVVCQINQYNFFTWPARFCEDEKICEIMITPYIFLLSPEVLILVCLQVISQQAVSLAQVGFGHVSFAKWIANQSNWTQDLTKIVLCHLCWLSQNSCI